MALKQGNPTQPVGVAPRSPTDGILEVRKVRRMTSREKLRWFIKGVRFGAALFGIVGAAFVLVTLYWGSSLFPALLRGELPDWSWQVYWTAVFPFPGAALCFIIMYGLTHYKKWTMYPLLLFALAFPSLYANIIFWPIFPAVIIGFFRHAAVRGIFTN
jgi:hypothetical protein